MLVEHVVFEVRLGGRQARRATRAPAPRRSARPSVRPPGATLVRTNSSRANGSTTLTSAPAASAASIIRRSAPHAAEANTTGACQRCARSRNAAATAGSSAAGNRGVIRSCASIMWPVKATTSGARSDRQQLARRGKHPREQPQLPPHARDAPGVVRSLRPRGPIALLRGGDITAQQRRLGRRREIPSGERRCRVPRASTRPRRRACARALRRRSTATVWRH